eukprot:11266648-Ditylum_brightwellii.AAC.1
MMGPRTDYTHGTDLYGYVTVPETTENAFIVLWSALYGDDNYLKKMNNIYSNTECQAWNNFPMPNVLRKFAALECSAEYAVRLIVESSQKNVKAEECHNVVKTYFSLPDAVIGAYGGHYCDEILGSPSDNMNSISLRDAHVGKLHYIKEIQLDNIDPDCYKIFFVQMKFKDILHPR